MKFTFIIYNLYKINANNEKLMKKSSFQISRNVEKSIEKLTNFVIEINLTI